MSHNNGSFPSFGPMPKGFFDAPRPEGPQKAELLLRLLIEEVRGLRADLKAREWRYGNGEKEAFIRVPIISPRKGADK